MNSDNWYDIIAVNIVFQTEIFNYLRIGDDFLMDDGPVRLFAFVILFLLSAYFSGSEISLASVNKIRIANHAENGDKAAQRVLYLLENFDKALSTLLIGNNIVNTAIATLSTVVTYDIFKNAQAIPDFAVPLCTLITTVAVFFLGEMIPKCFAKACNEKFAKVISRSLIFLMKILTPVSFIFSALSRLASKPFRRRATQTPTVTEDELYDIIETYVEENDIDRNTGEMVQNAIEFSQSSAKDVMTSWENVVCISADMPADDAAQFIRNCGHSRLPVTDDSGDVIGTLSIRRFLKRYIKDQGNTSVREVMSTPEFIPVSTPVDDLLGALSQKRTHLAYIKSDNKVLGIITVEDILEELVGEIYDEEDVIGGDTAV